MTRVYSPYLSATGNSAGNIRRDEATTKFQPALRESLTARRGRRAWWETEMFQREGAICLS